MAWLFAVFRAFYVRILILLAGLDAILRLAFFGLSSLLGRDGTFASRFVAKATSATGLRTGFDFARAFLPTLALSKSFVAAYENSGTIVVTRFDDVKDVLRRDDDFEVVYGPRMRKITGGGNFFLGMQDTAEYTRDTANMRLAVRRDDVATIIAPFAARRAAELVAACKNRIDVPQALTLRVPAELLGVYFGTPGPSPAQMIAWTTSMFWYLFIDLAADAGLDAASLQAAEACRTYLDAAVQRRKAVPVEADDVLNRCLAMQRARLPGMDDLGIRNNLIGLIIGAVPTTSKAAIQALDQLLERPAALAGAQRAAQANDDALLANYVFEALRFNPVNPLIYRRATRATTIAPNTLRAVTVPKGYMVMAANLSAMFDPLKIDQPASFRTGRPADNYILWGDGLHTCFGAHINSALIPALLKPLLAQPGLRRVAGAVGQIDTEGTPFPVHMWLEFGTA